jgi:hypothetical protein
MTDDEPRLPPDPDEPPPTPLRFMDDYPDDSEPYTDPQSGVTYPIDPRDVLDPEELREYQRERWRRR